MARGATIGFAHYISFNRQNTLTIKTTPKDWSLIGILIIPFQVSPIPEVNTFNKTYHIQWKLATSIHHLDRDILNLQSIEDVVQDTTHL